MCHLVREHSTATAEPRADVPPKPLRVRARWVGAVTAALVGGFAVAALDAPPPPPAAPTVSAAPIVPVAERMSVIPPAPLERTALPADDGVPSSTDLAKAGAGDCHHGL